MPKFAHYNPSANPSPIYGWYDTDIGVFPNLPDAVYLLQLTEEQWAARNSQAWQVQNGQLVPVPAIPLARGKLSKKHELTAAYQDAIHQDVAYMGTTFQNDELSQLTLTRALLGYFAAGSVPSGFYWLDVNNAPVSMTLAQLRGLLGAMLASQWTAFQRLQVLKGQVKAAVTAEEVRAVVW